MAAIEINGHSVDIEWRSLTMGEALEIEATFGEPFGAFSAALANESMRAIAALLLVLAHRADDNVRMADIERLELPKIVSAVASAARDDDADQGANQGAELGTFTPAA